MIGFYRQDDALVCDGLPLSRIAGAEGTPLYVYSAAVVAERYRAVDEAFASYPHSQLRACCGRSAATWTRIPAEKSM